MEDGAVLIDGKGNYVSEIYDDIYDDLSPYDPYVRYVSAGKVGYLDALSGKITIPAQYQEASEMGQNALVSDGRSSWFISEEGCDIGEMDELDGYAFITGRKGGKGLVDFSGAILLEPVYQEISYPEHLYNDDTNNFDLVVSVRGSNGKYGLFFLDGSQAVEVLPMEFDDKFDFSEKGRAGIVKKDGVYGLVDRDAFQWIEIENVVDVRGYSWGMAVAKAEDGYVVFDENGDETFYKEYAKIQDFWDGYAIVEKDGKYGFIVDSGAKGLEPEYDSLVQLGPDSFFRNNYYLAEKDGEKQILYLHENDGGDLEYSVILDHIESVDGRSMEKQNCWCVQLCDKEDSRRFVSFQMGEVVMNIPLPQGGYCSGFCNVESDKRERN